MECLGDQCRIHGQALISTSIYASLLQIRLSFLETIANKIQDDEASRAARLLGIDYADALTGFEFRGRHGTAVLKGIVVAAEYREAVEAVIEGFRDDLVREEEQRRSLAALKGWKRFLVGLRIKERVDEYREDGEGEDGEGEDGEGEDGEEEDEDEYREDEEEEDEVGMESDAYDEEGGGGFFPE